MDMEKIYREIAKKYGVSENEVKSEMQAALRVGDTPREISTIKELIAYCKDIIQQ